MAPTNVSDQGQGADGRNSQKTLLPYALIPQYLLRAHSPGAYLLVGVDKQRREKEVSPMKENEQDVGGEGMSRCGCGCEFSWGGEGRRR